MDLFTTNWKERASSDPVVNWMFRDYIYQQDKINTNSTAVKIQDNVPKSDNNAKNDLKNAKISSSTTESSKTSSKKSRKSRKSKKHSKSTTKQEPKQKEKDTVTTAGAKNSSKKVSGVTQVPTNVGTSSGGYPLISKDGK